jgi:hypothetical protein
VGRAAPRPDTTNPSGVQTLVPAGATPPAHPPEPHSKPASRPPGLSVIPPFPAGYAQYLTFRTHIPRVPPASKGASNGRWTGHPSSPSIRNYASDLRGESTKPGLRRGRMRTAMRIPVPGSLSNSSSASSACPLAHAPRVHAGERFGAGTRRPLRSTNQSNRRDLRVQIMGFGCHRRRPAAGTSTVCQGRTMSESSQMSKVGVLIDRMSSGS